MRDIYKQAEQGRQIIEKHRRMDLTYSELNQFFHPEGHEIQPTNEKFELIKIAFLMGVAVGTRNSK